MIEQREDRVFAYYQGRVINTAQFMAHVEQVRRHLLQKYSQTTQASNTKVLNLCEDRYHFIVLFSAALLEACTTIMPANQSEGEIKRLQTMSLNTLIVDEADIEKICHSTSRLNNAVSAFQDLAALPVDNIVAEVYTSGTTGNPTANPKKWGALLQGAERVKNRFKLNQKKQHCIVTTLPPQHMFGFEMSVMLPLVAGVAVHHGKPFYPMDVQDTLASVEGEIILVTAPIHLKACTTIGMGWPKIDFILSATATLSEELAEKATEVFAAPVCEIYGCSEMGAIATRTLLESPDWNLLDGFELTVSETQAHVKTNDNTALVVLPDIIELHSNGIFSLVGRSTDLVKIGGKRGSIADITRRIKAIPGVEDAVIFMPSQTSDQQARLAALVVAPTLDVKEIRNRLAYEIDSVFLPRPIYSVAKLPYNNMGKLPYANLTAMLDQRMTEDGAC